MRHPAKIQPKIGIGIASLLVVVAGITTFMLISAKPRVVVPESVKQSADFGVVKSSALPIGFSVLEQPAYIDDKGLVLTTLEKDGISVTVSQQKKPADANLDQIEPREKFLTNLGMVYVLYGEKGKQQAIIDTVDSWIYVNTNGDMDLPTYKSFVNSLTR